MLGKKAVENIMIIDSCLIVENQNKDEEQVVEKDDNTFSLHKSICDQALDDRKINTGFTLTENCHHYTTLREVNWDIQKYWNQRHSLFSLYDKGIYMTDDCWFGVTPEPIAIQIAKDLAQICTSEKRVLIDMFSGAGGNVIAFALSQRWDQIFAIEKNASVIACAYHNSKIYNVQDKINWIHGDSFEYLSSQALSINPNQTVIFASPPWGGPNYQIDSVFNLQTMQPYSLLYIYDACKKMSSALYLPRTSDLRQIADLAPEEAKIEVVQYCMKGASKALVAYIPPMTEK